MSLPMSTFIAPPPLPRRIVAGPRVALPMVRARWYRRWAKRRGAVLWEVLHCTDGHEGPNKAEDVARMFATIKPKPFGNPRSAHEVSDSNSDVQCVPWDREAWAAGKKGNIHGEHFEMCGLARQTEADWLDAESLAMLCRMARVVADRCDANKLPREFVTAEGLRLYQPGITTHAEISKAFGETTHTDPGKGFPLVQFIQAVQEAA